MLEFGPEMNITSSNLPLEQIKTDALVIPIFENNAKTDSLKQLDVFKGKLPTFKTDDFSGKIYETYLIPSTETTPKILLVGMGKKEDFSNRIASNVAGSAARRLLKLKVKNTAFDASSYQNPSLIIEGMGLAEFNPGVYKTDKEKSEKIENLIIIGKITTGEIKKASDLVEAINWTRRIIVEPANQLTPKRIVEEARKIARDYRLSIEVFDEKQALRAGMGAFAGIAQGSHEPSYMLVLKYEVSRKATTLGVVGKGITFDSGGISIKPSDKMHEMKMDMAGAAAAVGFMKLVGQIRPKINVVAVTPLTENLPGGGALKPGDVVKSLSGKTIEVLNTDAEGRVVLADGLTYAQKLGATKIVDLATLTGAVIVALGNEATAILGNNQEFVDQVVQAGEESGERMWQLPLYPEHKEMLRSDIADMANIPPSRGAGVIAGGVFLQEFIENKNVWTHLDIAGTAWLDSEKPYLSKGPSGVGIKTLLNLVKQLEGTTN